MVDYKIIAEEYQTTDIALVSLAKKYKTCPNRFSKYLKKQNILTRRKVFFEDRLFKTIDSEEKAYWLGFLYADGCVTYSTNKHRYVIEICLAEKDKLHIEKFKIFLNTLTTIKYREKTKAFRLSICSKLMCEDLINLGCFSNKSLTLQFPTEEQVPKKFIKHFIRGYFDGDGCISNGNVSLLGTFEFLNSIKELFNFTELPISKDKRHLNNTFYLRFRRAESSLFLHTIYNNSNVYLERKYNKYVDISYSSAGKKFLNLLNKTNNK